MIRIVIVSRCKWRIPKTSLKDLIRYDIILLFNLLQFIFKLEAQWAEPVSLCFEET